MIKLLKNIIRNALEKAGLIETRESFVRRIVKTGLIGAELGVFQGNFSKILLRITSPQKLFLVDPYWKIGDQDYGDWTRKYNNGEILSKKMAYEQAKAVIESVPNKEVISFHVEDDIKWLNNIPDNYLDWVYLDTSHTYLHTKDELSILDKKMKADGVILGDDWKTDPLHPHFGMRKAIEEFCASSNWKIYRLNTRIEQWCIKRKEV